MPIHSSLSLVIDSNIWIYLIDCGLLDAAFGLGTLHVPDLMLMKEPLTELSWHEVQAMGATFDELSSESVATLGEILDATGGVSVCDVACLVLAEQLRIPLVTHDKKLLAVARKRDMHTYNYDAFLELMVQANIIGERDRQTAFDALVRVDERPR
jgi:hypothetical protein